ncbi:hypothetical protein PF005_g32195 [Phytophthora fragariae]|uniref:glucan endo-1,3-beta-D-glucosidase n=1 Tax=Phytophthora fragariae TaxID=53985 RepID=A0A6A3V8X7_9STRA|nr:hypothetical protein PF003_g37512 [Phytophthora fragariae]KAE8917197.1 hypothetical protein PF009_g32481 [Phytophthora fragariae]KAE9057055.1 hypothetical protein PF007_g31778 [Phytophthora fragariae]KAE9060705.1 hypothetical protein PF006_g31583 [Phytophthora fragariae]KAE9070488.1 hypothetical protein PF010_g26251 [Phytophthora fragariae]
MYDEFVADTAISYVNEIRGYLRSRGKNTPVTLADTVNVYSAYPQLVDAVDYVSVNYQSFMHGDDVNESVANCNGLHMQAQSNTTTSDESAHREQELPSAYLPVAQALAPASPNQPLHV